MLGIFEGLLSFVIIGLFAASPSSTNYTLKAYDFGTGGGSSSSTGFNLNSLLNGQVNSAGHSTSYSINPGIIPAQNSNVPPAPVFTNPNEQYNRLHLTINEGGNPAGTVYLIAISDDNFATTLYIQPDNTVSASYNLSNYQTYTAWGGVLGFWVLGLDPDTTYSVKVKALNGDFSESAFGPIATAATVPPSLTFSVETTASSTPPFAISFTNLSPGSVVSADSDAKITISTNALFGGAVYISDSNSGLKSQSANYSIDSVTTDLSLATKGYGAQAASVSQASGGPLSANSPYNGVGDNVGAVTINEQLMLSSSNPINNGLANIRFKARTNITVPSSGDYSDVLTFIAAMSF